MTTDQYRDDLTALLPPLWRDAMVKCRDPDRAKDLVQATRERALSRNHQFQTRPGSTPGPSRSYNRSGKTISAGSLSAAARALSMLKMPCLSTLVNPPKGRFSSEMLQAVDKLPEAQKEVVYLVYVQGLSYEEAAATLEIPAGTLTSRLVRGRTKIAAMISDPSAQKRSSE